MDIKFLLFFFCILLTCAAYKRVCYYTNWSQYRVGIGKYLPTNYEQGLCTHIIYAFAKIGTSSNGYYGIEKLEWNDFEIGYKGINKHKEKDSQLKTLLAIGGWKSQLDKFSGIVKSDYSIRRFARNVISYLKTHNFDGLDLDWEFPASSQKSGFTSLCRILKEEFLRHGLLLSAAVHAGRDKVSTYEISKISQHLDFINLMAYDLYGFWDKETGHHTNANSSTKPENVVSSVNLWIKYGANPGKIIIGLATYGRTQRIVNSCDNRLGASTNGKGEAGTYTSEAGFLAYYEICKLNWSSKTCTLSSSAIAPYGVAGRDFIGNDDEESIYHKVLEIVKPEKLGGVMFWALDFDDFTRYCGKGKYPLIKAARSALYSTPTFNQCQNIVGCGPSPPSTCQMPPFRYRQNCHANPNGLFAGISQIDQYCRTRCENEENCCADLCCCQVKGSTTPTTSTTTTTTATTTTTTTTTKPPSTTCQMPPVGQRSNCRHNKSGDWGSASGYDQWCKSTCPTTPSCQTNMCCCD